MAAIYADHDVPASEPLAHRQRVDACLRAVEVCDWDRLTRLAQHMADKRLVRAATPARPCAVSTSRR